jgi:rhodanese-related sulfurtransferase
VVATWGIPFVGEHRELAAIPDSLLAANSPVPMGEVPQPVSISLSQAKLVFDRKQAVFVDARPVFEYADGHIAGAVNIPFEEIEYFSAAIANLDKNGQIVVYCSGESCDLSIHLGDALAKQGFSGVRVFFGGWVAWQRAGFPISR